MNIDISNACVDESDSPNVPKTEDIQHWVQTTIDSREWSEKAQQHQLQVLQAEAIENKPCELSIRIVDEAEIAELNATYRNKSGPTNVLSFPADLNQDIPLLLLGDIVISAPTILREAREQGKTAQAHWAHMIVHGTLHLLGFDHQNAEEAGIMEAIETSILSRLAFPAPYESGGGSQTESSTHTTQLST